MKIVKRQLQASVLEALKFFPAVYINGPRQAGKTTLVQELLAVDGTYLTFDDALERAAAMQNPSAYLKASGVPLIIDEVQMVPDLFRPLKKRIDEQRQQALHHERSANGHYLLTGSANLLAIPELANAMVGRMASLTLLPLSMNEVNDTPARFLQRCFASDFSDITTTDVSLAEAISQATFPELRMLPANARHTWFRNYVQKITLEDPQHLYKLEKAEYMPILLQILAGRAGSLLNDASLGREIGLTAVTTRHYRSLLNNTFITQTLEPWHRNINKRLVKSPKLYFHDSLLLCHLLQATPEELVKQQPQRFGHVLENFVLSELQKCKYATNSDVNIRFYRSSDGQEVDFILEHKQKLVAIEVKHAESISPKDVASMREFQQLTGSDFQCGIILCNTPRVIAYDDDIYLLPFSALWS